MQSAVFVFYKKARKTQKRYICVLIYTRRQKRCEEAYRQHLLKETSVSYSASCIKVLSAEYEACVCLEVREMAFKLLLVEDDAEMREIITDYFTEKVRELCFGFS